MRHEIWIFSGLGSSIFRSLRRGTAALDRLIDQLPYAESETAIWDDWEMVAKGIVERWQKTKDPFSTILIGHSNGVIATNSVAEYLRKRGLRVDYIAAIDPTAGRFPLIGHNVHECSEFWATSGWPHLTRRWTDGKRAALHFTDAWPGIHRLYHIKGGHVPCASNPKVHAQIISDLSRVLG